MTKTKTVTIVLGVSVGLIATVMTVDLAAAPDSPAAGATEYLANDSHLHLTDYVQEGTDIHDMLRIMGGKIGRAALFGIPTTTWIATPTSITTRSPTRSSRRPFAR
jgi:hypothetical protein